MPHKRNLFLIAIVAGLFGVLAGAIPQVASLEESLGLHLLFHLRGVRQPPDNLLVVALDRQSSRRMDLPMEPRKWPRSVHARLIDRLHDAGADVIVFDLIFNEPQTPETDQALADAIHKAGKVVLAQSVVDDKIEVADRSGALQANVNIEKTVPAIPLLADAAYAQAPFLVPRAPIKVSRYWTFKPGSGDIPTMPVVAFYAYAQAAWGEFAQLLHTMNNGATPAALFDIPPPPDNSLLPAIAAMHALFQKEPGLGQRMADTIDGTDTRPVARHVHTMIQLAGTDTYRYIDFYGPAGTIPTVSYYQMMAETDRPAMDLTGKVVFVGQTESYWPKAKDGFYTVYADETAMDISGVEIAATAFANLVENRAVRPLAPTAGLLIVFGLAAAGAALSFRLPTAVAALCVAALTGAYLLVAHLRFSAAGTWMPVILPLGLLPLTWVCALAGNYRAVSRERRTIREAFGYFLPNKIVDQLSRNIQAIQSERQVVYSICLFTDAEKYTNLSEAMDPASLTELMNQYYEVIFKPIRDNGGIVLQVIGDSVLSLWTAAGPDPSLKAGACNAALAIAEAVERFNRRTDGHALPTRIGLHAGDVLLGNIGAMDHFEYRPVGDIVNTASRLEGLNKYLGTRILISDEVFAQTGGFVARDVGDFVFVGKRVPIAVLELVSRGAVPDSPWNETLQTFAQGLQAFRNRHWDAAEKAFSTVLDATPGDGPSMFYLERCREYRDTPPDDGWNGTIHLSKK